MQNKYYFKLKATTRLMKIKHSTSFKTLKIFDYLTHTEKSLMTHAQMLTVVSLVIRIRGMLFLILSNIKKYLFLVIKCNAGILVDPTLGVEGKLKGTLGETLI